jgi:hypothetical protein
MASVNEPPIATPSQEAPAGDLPPAEDTWMEYGESLINNQRVRNMHLHEHSLEIRNDREIIVAATINGNSHQSTLGHWSNQHILVW